jgi:hypothetical protein
LITKLVSSHHQQNKTSHRKTRKEKEKEKEKETDRDRDRVVFFSIMKDDI